MADNQMHTERNGRIWIERGEQAKQGMARKENMKDAQASPAHPHIVGGDEEQLRRLPEQGQEPTNKD